MHIFYTGSAKSGGIQTIPAASLGGFIANSLVPNGSLNNLFDQLSIYTIQNGRTESRVIALYNEGLTILTGLKAYFEYLADESSESNDGVNQEIGAFKIGYLTPTANDCGEVVVEQLPNIYSIPYGSTLIEATVDNQLTLPDIESHMYLGIVIQRIIPKQDPIIDSVLAGLADGSLEPVLQENILLQILWT